MKEKEPNRSIFSAEESPVPLPSVEEAWSDMRKRLDEEMPERIVFFWFRRGTLLGLLLLLSAGAFLLIRRTGETTRATAVVDQHVEKQADQPDGVAGQGKEGATERRKRAMTYRSKGEGLDPRKEGGGSGERPTMEGSGNLRLATGSVRKGKLQNAAEKEDVPSARAYNERTDRVEPRDIGIKNDRMERSNGKVGSTRASKARTDVTRIGITRTGITRTGIRKTSLTKMNDPDLQRAVIDPQLVHAGTPDPIRVTVGMPRRIAGTGKKNPPIPGLQKKSGKSAKEDSTRILWAAGLQDSKSFPVGAQQAYNYDANLKKDLWADYIPSPYFQYHISRKIAFQTALQLNNPQYTESVTIFRKAGDTSGGVQITNDTTVTVRKLYYFNIPFLVYYSPLRNLYLGAGLQFSNLRNGIAFQNNVVHHVGGSSLTDTVTSSTVISLKENRPAYNNLRMTDWRALFEMNYYWKRITLGLQYQQALGNYLYTPVEGSSGRDRNSSFDVYLRYNLWERRIKIAPTRN